jgi:hypothetical protein
VAEFYADSPIVLQRPKPKSFSTHAIQYYEMVSCMAGMVAMDNHYNCMWNVSVAEIQY